MDWKKADIIYSEPVREIMGNPPRIVLRYGSTMIFVIFLLVIFFAWFFRYPDLVPSPVEITTENPPVTLVEGYLQDQTPLDKERGNGNQGSDTRSNGDSGFHR